VEIVRAGAERIPDLQPLWESLSRHHAEVAPELVGHVVVSVIASNADAVRFYERLGLTRFLVTFAGQVPPAANP
jgi:hypothetical protein